MSCTVPLDAAILADYWLGILLPDEEDGIEEHLFVCDDCGHRFREVIEMAEGLKNLAKSGALTVVISESLAQRFAADGLRIREYAPPAGGEVACTVTMDDDVLLGHLAADLRGASRIDVSFCDEKGAERFRLADVPFDSASGQVTYQQSIVFAKAAPSDVMIARLMAVDESGGERMLGEYTFRHTRTIPGPPGW